MSNIFVKLPKIGDIVVGDTETNKLSCIALESLDLDTLDSKWEVQGAVFYREGKDVWFAAKGQSSKKWCNTYIYKITGYTLDGSEHDALMEYNASTSASSPASLTMTYNATTIEELAQQLNSIFATNEQLTAQDFRAYIENEALYVARDHTSSYQSFKLTGGMTSANSNLPDVPYTSNMLRKNGRSSGEGLISSLDRAITYFKQDVSSSSYNPTSAVTSIKITYPICLPAYLGTSAHRDGDKCAFLREHYGEGEEGWLRFMKSFLPVLPTNYGNMREDIDGYALTKQLAEAINDKGEKMCDAAVYCHEYATTVLPAGSFYLPRPIDIYRILEHVQTPVNNTGGDNILGKAMAAIGGTALSNGTSLWSCCRSYAGIAWCAYGAVGFFSNDYFCYSGGARPVSLFTLES